MESQPYPSSRLGRNDWERGVETENAHIKRAFVPPGHTGMLAAIIFNPTSQRECETGARYLVSWHQVPYVVLLHGRPRRCD